MVNLLPAIALIVVGGLLLPAGGAMASPVTTDAAAAPAPVPTDPAAEPAPGTGTDTGTEAGAGTEGSGDLVPFAPEGDFRTLAEQLPAELAQAVERDLGTSPEDYLARVAAADSAVDVVGSLEGGGVDVLGSRLEGTRLVVNVADEADAALVRSTGAQAELGEPAETDYSGRRLEALADLIGGEGYVFSTLVDGKRYNNLCSVAFNGTSKSTGQRQFLTAGHCLAPDRQDGGVFFEAAQSSPGTVFTRGAVLGTPIESAFRFGAGADVGAVATASGVTVQPRVTTWGGGQGSPNAGTPASITGTTPGIVGAPVCKSGTRSGWTCGDVLALSYSTPVYNRSGTPVIVNTVLTSVCMLPGDSGAAAMTGSSALGVGTAGDWVDNCDRASQPDAISAFFPLVTTDGKPSVATALPDWQLASTSPYGNDWSPLGNFEQASSNLTTTTLRGWAFDPDTSAATQIHVYLDGTAATGGWGGAYPASAYRPDVGTAYPGAGGNRGFSIDFATKPKATRYCLYAINTGLGATTDLGCKTVSPPTGPPVGNVERATLDGLKASVTGWAIDPDVAASIPVHVYVNGRWGGQYVANVSRPDVGAAYPGYGALHGFSITGIPVTVGTSSICVYGIDQVGTLKNSELGCRTVSTASGPPRGSLDSATGSVGGFAVSGWALDPDTPDPVTVHVYVDGGWGGSMVANGTRTDVAAAFPGYGDAHGYSLKLAAAGGSHSVCVYGINTGPAAANPLIACRTVVVPGGNPVGNLESATVSSGMLTAVGWSIDPDVVKPVSVHLYVDGAWSTAAVADVTRSDVGRAYPAYGPGHGYRVTVAVPAGAKQVCAYAINTGTGSVNPLLGCLSVR